MVQQQTDLPLVLLMRSRTKLACSLPASNRLSTAVAQGAVGVARTGGSTPGGSSTVSAAARGGARQQRPARGCALVGARLSHKGEHARGPQGRYRSGGRACARTAVQLETRKAAPAFRAPSQRVQLSVGGRVPCQGQRWASLAHGLPNTGVPGGELCDGCGAQSYCTYGIVSSLVCRLLPVALPWVSTGCPTGARSPLCGQTASARMDEAQNGSILLRWSRKRRARR